MVGWNQMASNSRFAMGVHALSLLASDPERSMTSEEIAAGIDTNPVVVRRILASLQGSGLVKSQKGPKGGSRLADSAKKITLARIYEAIEKRPFLHVPYNVTGIKDAKAKRVAGSIKETFLSADKAIKDELESISLAQIIKRTERGKK
jgi:Rrf2 family protein